LGESESEKQHRGLENLFDLFCDNKYVCNAVLEVQGMTKMTKLGISSASQE